MIPRKGDFEYFKDEFSRLFGLKKAEAEKVNKIHFTDPDGWPNPLEKGPVKFTLTKGEKAPNRMGPTLGPRFRPEHVTIHMLDEKGAVIFTNEEKPAS